MVFKKTVIEDDNGRVCSCCKQYKEWNEFSVDRSRFNSRWRSYDCLECRREKKRAYRQNWWYAKDHEYKYKKRHLEIGDQIYFNSEIWEVIDHKYNWYIVKSIVNWDERRISTSDNHCRRNNNCIRFVKLKNPVVLMRTREKPQFEVKTDGETFELTPPPKEEKKFSIDLDELLENGEGW